MSLDRDFSIFKDCNLIEKYNRNNEMVLQTNYNSFKTCLLNNVGLELNEVFLELKSEECLDLLKINFMDKLIYIRKNFNIKLSIFKLDDVKRFIDDLLYIDMLSHISWRIRILNIDPIDYAFEDYMRDKAKMILKKNISLILMNVSPHTRDLSHELGDTI